MFYVELLINILIRLWEVFYVDTDVDTATDDDDDYYY